MFPQNVDLYLIPQNVETLIGNNENVYLDPFWVDNLIDFPGITATQDRFNINEKEVDEIANTEDMFTSFDIDAEFGWSKTAKFVDLPLAYFYKDFEFSLQIPFYFQKQVFYSHGYVSTMGLGDLTLLSSWKYNNLQVFDKVSIAVSIPTGNQNKSVGGYLCPLGTGSYDIIFDNQFQLNKPNYAINSILTYRYSGQSKRKIIISYPDIGGFEQIEYFLSNGHTVSLNSSFNFYLTNYMSVFGGFSLMRNTSGKLSKQQKYSWNSDIIITEGQVPFQEFFIADIKCALAFTLLSTDIVFVLSQPVYTWRKSESVENDRKLNYYIKLSRNIF